jgi:hypothetical protein
VDVSAFGSIDEFIEVLRDYVHERSYDRAAAEAEYEARFSEARVYADDIDRIMNSAYFYTLSVTHYDSYSFTCPESKVAALLMGCTPGEDGIKTELKSTASFYRANLIDEDKPAYELIKTVRPPVPVEAFVAYNRQTFISPALAGAKSAAAKLTALLAKKMKEIPDFQLKSPIIANTRHGVEFMLGKNDGVRLDGTYDVTEFSATGQKSLIGYVKVRSVGSATLTNEGTPSFAEKIKEKHKFIGGELLFEHPMIGFNIGIHGVFEYCAKDLVADDSNKQHFYKGGGLYIDYDLARLVGTPEFYLSAEGDCVYVDDWSLALIHAMIGIKKKWYAKSFVFIFGIRGGISYYLLSEDIPDESSDTLIGGGGDVMLGVEYYIVPECSIYLNAAGRFFTNPLQFVYLDTNSELGAIGQFGVRLGF